MVGKVYEKPVSPMIDVWAKRLNVSKNICPVKYSYLTFFVAPAVILSIFVAIGLNNFFSIVLSLLYPIYKGFQLYIYCELQNEQPRPFKYVYSDSTPFYIRYGMTIIIISFCLIAFSVFYLIPKFIISGVLLIMLSALVVWKTATLGRNHHKEMQEIHGISRAKESNDERCT